MLMAAGMVIFILTLALNKRTRNFMTTEEL